MDSEEKPSKRELIQQILRKRRERKAVQSGIPQRDKEKPARLSAGQERLWFLEQFSPDSQAYNRPAHLRLKGKLNVDALRRTLNAIVQRHDTLRTRFVDETNGPVQEIATTLNLHLHEVDLRNVAKADQEEAARKLVEEETMLPFDLSNGPLVRTKLIRQQEEEHLLLITLHHIIFDGWSQSILYKEISSYYKHFTTGASALQLPELPVQYADFAQWQRRQMDTGILDKDITYWKDLIKDSPDVLALPTDRPRPRIQTYSGARHTLYIPNVLLRKVTRLSQQNQTTPFVVLLTAFFTLLHRYSNQTDITVGFPIAGRQRPELERMIGFFINTLVLRGDLSGEPSFINLLGRIHDRAMKAYEHHKLPFESLLQKLKIDRDLSHSPLFQVFFQYRNYPKEDLNIEGLAAERYELDRPTEKFDLFVDTQQEKDGSLRCQFRYNTDLFDASTIERMAGHFKTVIEQVTSHPETGITDFNLLSKSEKQEVIIAWNDTKKPLPKLQTIHHQFEAQVDSNPDKVAIRFANQEISYLVLETQANRLAQHLISKGVQVESLIAIHLEPRDQELTSLLAILKAGGAFVPIDTDLPE